MSLEIVYQEQNLNDVLAYWVKDYKPIKGEKIFKSEYIIDAPKNLVVFKLFMEIPDDPKPKK